MVTQEKRKHTDITPVPEYSLFDGECYITFWLVGLSENMTVTIAMDDRGKIIVKDYDLYHDKDGELYFEYGVYFTKIYLNDFEIID